MGLELQGHDAIKELNILKATLYRICDDCKHMVPIYPDKNRCFHSQEGGSSRACYAPSLRKIIERLDPGFDKRQNSPATPLPDLFD